MEMVDVIYVFHTGKGPDIKNGKGRWLKAKMISGGIKAWTGFLALFYNWKLLKAIFGFSHMEVWVKTFHDQFCCVTSEGVVYLGECFSSTTRGAANGVRFAPAGEVLKHPERWRGIRAKVEKQRYEVGMAEARRLVGGGYDYGYILSFMQPFVVQKDGDWACSEICMWLGFLWRHVQRLFKRISPRRAAYELSKKWGEPKPLEEII